MRTLMLVMIAAAALALAAWLLLRGVGEPPAPASHRAERTPRAVPASPPPAARPGGLDAPSPTSPTAAPTPIGGGALPAEARPRSAIDHGRAWATLPAVYPMKALSPASVAVNLSGAPVSMYAMAPPGDPPATRPVRGRVLEGGAPAPGVTVIVGQRLMIFAGHLSGAAAAVTDGDGRFTLAAPPAARWALALGPHSWSALTPVGDGELAIALAPAAAELEVTVREDGAPLDATLTLALGDGVAGGTVSAPDGVFRFAALPPGPARLTVGASLEFASGADAVAPVDVTLVAGEVVRRTIALDSANATVAAVPVVAAGGPPRTVEWALVAPPVPASLAELRDRAGSMPLFGGVDAANTYQFHRIAPAGARVACAIAKLAGASDDAPPVVRWGCAPVDVPARGVVEVEVAIDRPAE
ncbi:MAG: hypothetical protein JNK64_22305 [Myxococcales bacterium]|nr:hypothetical protein [Myxococcales bacterium]